MNYMNYINYLNFEALLLHFKLLMSANYLISKNVV